MKKTLQLNWPRWQGGQNPKYMLGSVLMDIILPVLPQEQKRNVPVLKDLDKASLKENGIDGYQDLLAENEYVKKILEQERPDRIVTAGGDCSVSHVPFDYLSGKYPDDFGIVWLDAHPDIALKDTSSHLHEMPVSSLLGMQQDDPLTKSENPLSPDNFCMAGLIEEDLREMDKAVKKKNMLIVSPEKLAASSKELQDWIEKNGIRHVAVHFDLDVLNPQDFRSIYPAEPGTDPADFPAAVGRLALADVIRILQDLSSKADLVGLTIAEHLPWDALRLREGLESLPLFS